MKFLILLALILAGCTSKAPAGFAQCSVIQDQATCKKNQCGWTQNMCVDSCAKIKVQADCKAANISGTQCQYVTGANQLGACVGSCDDTQDSGVCAAISGCVFSNNLCVAVKSGGGTAAAATQCSEIAVQANCKEAVFGKVGCYWNAGVCASAAACSNLSSETACKASTVGSNTAACVWVDLDGTGFNCQDPTPCNTLTDANSCNQVSGCSWFSSGSLVSTEKDAPAACQAVTACDQITDKNSCVVNQCKWGGSQCYAQFTSCANITDESICSAQENCGWSSTACVGTCNFVTTQTACLGTVIDQVSCQWFGNCAGSCADILEQASCASAGFGSTQCVWTGTVCGIKPPDPTACGQISDAGNCAVSQFNSVYCLWDSIQSTCSAAVACSQFSSAIDDNLVACQGTTLGGNSCAWTKGAAASCTRHNPARDYNCAFTSTLHQIPGTCGCTDGAQYRCSGLPGKNGVVSASCVFTPAATGGTCQ